MVYELGFYDIPEVVKAQNQRTYRSITIEGKEIEFSGGFTDLHTKSYQEILDGRGFTLADARDSINTVFHIRNTKPMGMRGDYHPFLKNANCH